MEEIEELESQFNDHFGLSEACHREANSPEVADQESDEEETPANQTVDDQIARYLESQNEHSDNDDDDNEPFFNVQDLPNLKLREGCGCASQCFRQFPEQDIIDHIWVLRDLEKNEKELQIMAVLQSVGVNTSETRRCDRKRSVYQYRFNGKKVCRNAFMVLYDVHDFTLRALINHIHEHGLTPRVHGNKGRKPKHALLFDDVKRVVTFLQRYAEDNGMPQPAAPRGRPDIPPIFLHSSLTKALVHKTYVTSLADEDTRIVKLTAFKHIWRSCVPHIQIANPRMDVCAKCETKRKDIMDAVTDQDKLNATQNMRQHLLCAQRERDIYIEMIKKSKDGYQEMNSGNENRPPRNTHYTFDFAQNVTLPHHARQMGPLYFLTLKKVQVFGFRVDGVPHQLNYLFDEGQSIGVDGKLSHGPNAVISMVDNGFSVAGFNEDSCSLHADNCAGQNKNRYLINYLSWRVMVGGHKDISLHFQIPGHTRCLIDAGFACFKRTYRRCDADSILDLEHQVNLSSTTNEAVLYPQWQWFDWKEFLAAHFKALPGISSYQHFRFSSDHPGKVFLRKTSDETEIEMQLLKDPTFRFEENMRPNIITPPGISRERQLYLYTHVRKYVRRHAQDLTCPIPSEE